MPGTGARAWQVAQTVRIKGALGAHTRGFPGQGDPCLDASRNPAGGCPTVLGVNELLLESFALLYLESACTVSLPHRRVLFALLLNRKALRVRVYEYDPF